MLAHAVPDAGLGDDEVPQRVRVIRSRELVAQLADVHVHVAVLALVLLASDSA